MIDALPTYQGKTAQQWELLAEQARLRWRTAALEGRADAARTALADMQTMERCADLARAAAAQ